LSLDHAVVIAATEDLHARVVSFELSKLNVKPAIICLNELPERLELSQSFAWKGAPGYRLTLSDGTRLTDDRIAGVWWRRTHPFGIPDAVADKEERRFCSRECDAQLDGWLHSLGRKLINPFANEIICRNKPYQLMQAERFGLSVPATLVTNSPSEAAAFCADHGGAVVFKTLSNHPGMETPFTRKLPQEAVDRFDALKTGPVQFQKMITGGIDIRITVIDMKVFAAEISVSAPQAEVDWRIDPNSVNRVHALPEDFEKTLVDFHRALGLRFGAYDFRTDADGTYWFLEVNTGGQYLWIETETGLPISAALASAIVNGEG
jgi:glutathione synthase/RimK-type ligase-like ATP-grasp enzyme